MIQLDDVIIQADLAEILDALKTELSSKGIERFSTRRIGVDNIQTNCPFHSGGHEKKPSFGIHKHSGKAHCFSCGWSGDLSLMISQIFGYSNDSGKFGKNWLIKKFNSVEIDSRPNILYNTFSSMPDTPKNIVSDSVLDSYRYYHPYMFERGLKTETIDEFDIGYNRQTDCITFPILDLEQDCVFVAERSVKGKVFKLPAGIEKPVYQAYRFITNKYKICYVAESFFNCLTLWQLGLPAVALMGTGTSYQYSILRDLPVREYILALDNDKAGDLGTKRFRKFVNNKIIKQIEYKESGKDINDLREDFLKLNIIF